MSRFAQWRLPILAFIMIGVEVTTFENTARVLSWLNPAPHNYLVAGSFIGLFIFTIIGATATTDPTARKYLGWGTALLLGIQALANVLAQNQFATKLAPMQAAADILFLSPIAARQVIVLLYGLGLGLLSLIAWKVFAVILHGDRDRAAELNRAVGAVEATIPELRETVTIAQPAKANGDGLASTNGHANGNGHSNGRNLVGTNGRGR